LGFYRYLESRIQGTATPAEAAPPAGLLAFYWHFMRQTRGWYALMFVTSLSVALVDTAIPVFIGQLVALMEAPDRLAALTGRWPVLLGMAAVVVLLRPLAILADVAVRLNGVIPGATTLIRWQSHWHVVRQNWGFFQNDFAGRIANRVMQTAISLRESAMAGIRAVWYIAVYGATAIVLMAQSDWRIALPTLLWSAGYVAFLSYFVPRMRELSKLSSEGRSLVMARIVDSYTNILTVKLFARPALEDAYVRESVVEHQGAVAAYMRTASNFIFTLALMNAALLLSTAVIGLWLWAKGDIAAAAVATALPLAWQITMTAGWVSWEVAAIFENVGMVQEGMQTIAVPLSGADRPDARPLHVTRGEIRIENLTFRYGRKDGAPVLHRLNLVVRPGERVGLVGRSGAGKSTLVNLLLRFHELEEGSIRIDGQEVREVTQESLRAAIGMVTQDTSLLHRSIAANIRYGRPEATDAEVVAAAKKAHAHEFILELRDWKDRTGYEAHVGERREALRRPAPAHRHRARRAEGRADPGAGRSHLGARQRGGARDPGTAARPHGGQDGDRDRAPALHHRAHGPAGGAGRRAHRRAGHARGAAAPGRRLREALAPPVRRLPRAGRRRGGHRGGAAAGSARARRRRGDEGA
jgi:ATP-binding cassette subfamily B multidrug efflux pump